MARKLRLPETLVFVALTGLAGCGGDELKPLADAAGPDAGPCLAASCVPDGVAADGGPACPACADEMGQCPPGCFPTPMA